MDDDNNDEYLDELATVPSVETFIEQTATQWK